MPARFAPAPGHPILTDAAKQLAPDALAAQAVQAEGLLSAALKDAGAPGLAAVPAPGVDPPVEDERLVIAVAMQVNFQVAQGGEGAAYGSETRGNQAVVYARDPRTGQVHTVSQAAVQMARTAVEELVPAATRQARPPRRYPGFSFIESGW